jgi:hypothetical protein
VSVELCSVRLMRCVGRNTLGREEATWRLLNSANEAHACRLSNPSTIHVAACVGAAGKRRSRGFASFLGILRDGSPSTATRYPCRIALCPAASRSAIASSQRSRYSDRRRIAESRRRMPTTCPPVPMTSHR